MTNCVACGKPLGGQTGLCYACQQDGEELAAYIEVADEIVDRVERYFMIASVRCANCGELHTTVTVDNETYTAETFGIDSVEEWELEMAKEEEWLRENEAAVRKALHQLEDEWPQSVQTCRETILK